MASRDTQLIIDHINELRALLNSDGGQKKDLTNSKTGSRLSKTLLTVSKSGKNP